MSPNLKNKKSLVVFTYPPVGDAHNLLDGAARVRIYRSRRQKSEADLVRMFRGAAGVVTLLSDPVTRTVLEACPGLEIVANNAVGYNNIDLVAARDLKITVTNTPGVLTESTADLTWALILAAARRIPEGERMMRTGRFRGWYPDLLLGMDLQQKLLGIVGMGRIGRAVARRAVPFGMRVAYHQRTPLAPTDEAALGARRLSLDSLLEQADVLSLHCPLTPETRHLIDEAALKRMKSGAVLINTARGPIVEEAALVKTLTGGRLFAAGLDVFEEEPKLAPGLKELHNVVLLPHIGSAGAETRAAMAETAVRNVLEVLSRRPPLNPVHY